MSIIEKKKTNKQNHNEQYLHKMILRRVKDYQSKALKDTPFREDRSPIDSDYLREDQEVTWSHVPSLSEDLSDSRHRLKLAHENRIQRTQWLEKFRVEKQYQTYYRKKVMNCWKNFQELYHLMSLNQDWMPLKYPQARPEFMCLMQELLDEIRCPVCHTDVRQWA